MANRMTNDPARAQAIIDKCDVCYMAMVDDNQLPYVLPFNFGYEDQTIYLHSAQEGKKMEILRKNPQVCIVFSTDHKLFHRHDTVACSYGMSYRSVLAHGRIEFIEEYAQKEKVLNIIMRKYAGREFSFNAPAVNNVAVYKVVIDKLEAKESNY